MGDFLGIFSEQLVAALARSSECSTKLVKFIDDSSEFDITFPISIKIWQNQLDRITDEDAKKYQNNILFYASESLVDNLEISKEFLISNSKNWIFSIVRIEIVKTHCLIALRRSDVYKKCLKWICEDYGKFEKSEMETVFVEIDNHEENEDSLTQYRVNLIGNVVKNLLGYSRYVQVDDLSIAKYKVFITSKSNPKKDENSRNDRNIILCGPVISAKDNKISTESTQEFIQQRMQDMHLIAVHKYGVRLNNSDSLDLLVRRLGESAAKLDLLEVKHSSPIKLVSDPKKAFILYNSARIETLLEKFDEREKEGYYAKLPGIDEIDPDLLVENEEFLLMKLILTFREIINHSINGLSQGKVSISAVHKFLTSLVNTFSIYYRRVRLLTSNQSQLMPSLHTKIHFVRLIRMILNKTLSLYNIQPVAFM